MQQETSFISVLKNPGFLNLWINQILVQLAYNSLNFTLILWVFQLTNSNTAVSALMLSIYTPAVLFGMIAGVIVDINDRKKIILIINFLLVLCFGSLIFLKQYYLAVLAIAFIVNTMAQFYTPAESSAIPLLVKKDQLLIANSLFSITLFSTFLIGFGLAGPLIALFGINAAFGLQAFLLAVAFCLATFFPSITSRLDEESKSILAAIKNGHYSILANLTFREIWTTLKLVSKRLPILVSIFILAGVQVMIGIIAVLLPAFLERTIRIQATDASYVMVLPLGLGMITGGLLVGKKGYLWAKRRIVGTAIAVAGVLFLVGGLAPLISPAIDYFPYQRPLPFFTQPPLALILAIGAYILGICLVSILVPSQTVIQEDSPEEDRGKIFAVLAVCMAAFSLLPVLFVGLVTDLVGTTPIFIMMGSLISFVGVLALKPNIFLSEKRVSENLKNFLGAGHWASKMPKQSSD